MNNLQPIPTTYNGITYRSRLEARWAMFFETFKLNVRYELEGFNLDGIYYLPDFEIFTPESHGYIEIKPTGGATDDAFEKCRRLHSISGEYVVIVEGTPSDSTWHEFKEGKVIPQKNPFHGNDRVVRVAEMCTKFQFHLAR